MARGRMVNKKISNDKRVNELSLQTQLLFTWLIAHLDCNGCFYGSAQMVKSLVITMNNWQTARLICWLRGIWRTVRIGLPVSGHNFVEVSDGNIQVLRCEACGHKSEAWRFYENR